MRTLPRADSAPARICSIHHFAKLDRRPPWREVAGLSCFAQQSRRSDAACTKQPDGPLPFTKPRSDPTCSSVRPRLAFRRPVILPVDARVSAKTHQVGRAPSLAVITGGYCARGWRGHEDNVERAHEDNGGRTYEFSSGSGTLVTTSPTVGVCAGNVLTRPPQRTTWCSACTTSPP